MDYDKRDWIIVVLDSIDEMILKIRKIAYRLTSEELEDFHHNFYDELGVNIYNNFKFMELVITRRLPSEEHGCIPRMNDDELAEYITQNWEQLVSETFRKSLRSKLINDRESFLLSPSIYQKN